MQAHTHTLSLSLYIYIYRFLILVLVLVLLFPHSLRWDFGLDEICDTAITLAIHHKNMPPACALGLGALG